MPSGSRNIAVILLGGRGQRFGSKLPKQFYSFKESPYKSIFEQATEKIAKYISLQKILLVIPSDLNQNEKSVFESCLERLTQEFPAIDYYSTNGGAHRHESFQKGISFFKEDDIQDKVFIVHDASRPFLSEDFLHKVEKETYNMGDQNPCSVPALQVADSLIINNNDENLYAEKKILSYLPRDKVYYIQTPQLLWGKSVFEAFRINAQKKINKVWTDEGSFMLEMGFPVSYYEGDVLNKKITYFQDIV